MLSEETRRTIMQQIEELQKDHDLTHEELLSIINGNYEKQRQTDQEMHIVALGVDTRRNLCTCIYSEASFDELERAYNKFYVEYSATNWEGRDDVNRTLSINRLKPTGRSFKRQVTVKGADDDMGHSYAWQFTFDTVIEVELI